jgi:ubiquitin-protein ligase E3 C
VYTQAFTSLFFSILPVPLLPNRIPLPSVTKLSSGLPLASFDVLLPIIPSLASLHTDSAIHVLANLLAFTPPRYRKLRPDALDAYLALLTTLLNSLPTNALDSEGNSPSAWTVWPSNDSDSEDDEPHLSRVERFTPQVPPPVLDSRTIKWISILPTQSHLTSLFHHPNRARLAAFMLALTTAWPAKKEAVLTISVAYNSSGLVRELYRLHVRSSVLGRDDAVGALMG